MVSTILDSNVTYESLIDSAATSLYNRLKDSSVDVGIYRTNISEFTIAEGMNSHSGRYGSASSLASTVTIEEVENRNENYIAPTKDIIVDDIKKFMSGVGIPINDTNPTSDGLISFFFALNFFVEKAVIKRAITAPNNEESSYHLHYKAPVSSSYSKVPFNYKELNSITTNKIENIYSQLKSTSLLSDNARTINIASSSHKSSCSSSSCSSSSSSSCSSSSSSSSCSSSSIFIAYFNIG